MIKNLRALKKGTAGLSLAALTLMITAPVAATQTYYPYYDYNPLYYYDQPDTDRSDDQYYSPVDVDTTTLYEEDIQVYLNNLSRVIDNGNSLRDHECYAPIDESIILDCKAAFGPYVPFSDFVDETGYYDVDLREYANTNYANRHRRGQTITYNDLQRPAAQAQHIPTKKSNPYLWLANPSYQSQLSQYRQRMDDNADDGNNYAQAVEVARENAGVIDMDTSAKLVREYFDRPGEEIVQNLYSNNSLHSASWDIQAYLSHPCFTVSGSEIVYCKQKFGRYYDLKDLLMTGELDEILAIEIAESPKLADLLETTRAEILLRDSADAIDAIEMNTTSTWRNRADAVWQYCQEQYEYDRAVLCYVKNDRIYLDPSVPFEPTYNDM